MVSVRTSLSSLLLLAGMLLSGCSATTGYAVFFEEKTRFSESKVSSLLVLAEADDYALAYAIETKVVETFADRGIAAQAYSDVVADTTSRSIAENLAALLEAGVDGIVALDVRGQGTNLELVSLFDPNTGLTRREYRVIEAITIDCAVIEMENLEPIWSTIAVVKNTAELPWLSTHERAFSHTLVKVLVEDGVVVSSE